MFEFIGRLVERHWRAILFSWLFALVLSISATNGWINNLGWFSWHFPSWLEVAEGGEFAYLPPQMQSLVGEKLLATAFPADLLKSSVVIVVQRDSHELVERDEEFIEKVLRPRLEKIQSEDELLVSNVKTFKDPLMGRLLVSEDKKASLVIVAFTSEFLEWRNAPTVGKIEKLLKEVNDEKLVPAGLALAMSGTATVGRDMLVAGHESAHATELWTTILVVILLAIIYQSPILALIPLLTVFMAVRISMALVTLLTEVPFMHYRIFMGMETYITVVVYGTGIDYCLFLVARYKEELDGGAPLSQGITSTLRHVGAALAASAATVICGIGMLVFAQFGKFREAGIGISLSLCVGLLAALTFTPSLLRWAGRWAFWPHGRSERIPGGETWMSGTRLIGRLVPHNRIQVLWERIGKWLVRSPGKILIVCLCVMIPFAFVGLWFHDYLSYGLLSELPASKQSVEGAKAVQEHFPAGYAGPLTIILRNDAHDFSTPEGLQELEALIEKLQAQQKKLGIADIRYVSRPLGMKYPSVYAESEAVSDSDTVGLLARRLKQQRLELERSQAQKYYVSSSEGNLQGHVTRIDVIFQDDPFTRESIRQLNAVEQVIADELPTHLKADSQFHYVGPTASIRDLKTVTDQDQVKIDILVLISVFLILVALLRKPAISLYLIVSVFFSYFVTLGATFAIFWWLDPTNFGGLDWKVPMFLFTILIAVGEDYNIFLMTRIEEEQLRYGAAEGVRIAVLRTGSIISSCGIIMAGTFCSLLASTLVGMQQLGFALAFGVLLDTFVVRPLLVPAYLIMLYTGRFGTLGRLLGERYIPHPKVPTSAGKARIDA